MYEELNQSACKEDFRKVLAEIAEVDFERMKRGEEPILLKSMEACFDLMDTDHDGFVTLDEYKRMMALGHKVGKRRKLT